MKKNQTPERSMFTKQNESKESRMKVLGRTEALQSKNTTTQYFSELFSVLLCNVIIYFQALKKQACLINAARTGHLFFCFATRPEFSNNVFLI